MCATAPRRQIPRLEELTLDEKIGQLFVVADHGVFMGEQSDRYQRLLHHVRDNHVGGIIWFVSDVYETAWLNTVLQREARVPLLISADLESGIGMRFNDTTYWPPAMAVAATGDSRLAEQEGRIVAREAKVLGVNHILAPVADVNVNPHNPVINTRSFGEDPAVVSRFAAAFVRGVQAEGLLATAKHFPGHGDTSRDSHRSLPTLEMTRERLDAIELAPFRAAIAAGVRSVMTGHLAVPVIDSTRAPVRTAAESAGENPYGTADSEIPAETALPASLSPKAVQGLLREELGFAGLIVTDALDMGALVAHFEPGEAAVRAIEAGNDQVLKSADPDRAIAAVRAAVMSGRLTEARIDQSVRRILEAKRATHHHVGSQQEIFATLDAPEHRQLAEEIARRAITLVRAQPGVVPLRKEWRVLIVHVSDFAETSAPASRLAQEIASRSSVRPVSMLLDSRSTSEDAQRVANAARDADVVLLALAIRTRSGAGHLALPEAARIALSMLPPDLPVVGVSFGSPYVLSDLPSLQTYVCAYGTQPLLQTAAARALFGETPFEGRLPVTIP